MTLLRFVRISALLTFALAAHAAPVFTTLYNFQGKPDGAGPGAYLTADKNGVLYGVAAKGAYDRGMVFSLTPPTSPGGAWTETILHQFTTREGAWPNSPLVLGPDGALYGTTQAGGAGYGIVYRLKPPASPSGRWRLAVLYAFMDEGDGAVPSAGLARDSSGVLYGTTTFDGSSAAVCEGVGCGTVFAVTPPAAPGESWTETVLYSFTGSNGDGSQPYTNVILGSGGELYGTSVPCQLAGCSAGDGNVYELSPPISPGGAWTETILHTFTGPDGSYPQSGVILGPDGSLYGTTYDGGSSGYGAVYQLAPPASPGDPWQENLLYSFSKSEALMFGPALGVHGELFGTTISGGRHNGGTVFKLAPPASGSGTWNRTLLHSFPRIRYNAIGGLLIAADGVLYGTSSSGGSGPCVFHHQAIGCGTVFALAP